jgi:tRNA nucleotidyltransferase/poly(A) polymerase
VRLAVTRDFSFDEATLDAMAGRATSIADVAPERVAYELALTLGCGQLREAVALLHATRLDVPLFGKALSAASFHDDGVSLAGALAALVDDPVAHSARWRWSDLLVRQVRALKTLLDTPPEDLRTALYDAGHDVARQLPALLRALGRPAADIPDDDAFYDLQPLLGGNEIAELTGLTPGRELGRVKRALLEAQLDGAVTTEEEAVAMVKGAAKTTD